MARRPYWALTLVVLVVLGPFVFKPFNIDEPLFIWAAKHICQQPLNPYGFDVNWYGTTMPMWQVTKNPPFASYYLAVVGSILGWSELALHAAFLLPAIAAVLGTYRLAARFCQQPIFASVLTLFSVGFMVSSTSVMCDTMMLAFWLWAVVLWIEGLEKSTPWRFVLAACCMSLAALTKYFGLCVVPLLVVYSLLAKYRPRVWVGYLFIPLIALLTYQLATRALYGEGLLAEGGRYAFAVRENFGFSLLANAVVTMAFVGGCLLSVTLFLPAVSGWRITALCFVGAVAATVVVLATDSNLIQADLISGTTRVWLGVQLALWAAGGSCLLAVLLKECFAQRDAFSYLLGLWVVGTIAFTACFNWVVNARSILPMIPPAAILMLRAFERLSKSAVPWKRRYVPLALAVGLFGSLLITHGDYLFARAMKQAAGQTAAKVNEVQLRLWFQGHWGFQYYMELLGATAVDVKKSALRAGDCMVLPLSHPNMHRLKPDMAEELGQIIVQGPSWLTTMNPQVGAGFYASNGGPLPFAMGRVPAEAILVYVLKGPPISTGQDTRTP